MHIATAPLRSTNARSGEGQYVAADRALDAMDAIFTRVGRPGQRAWLDGRGGECPGCQGIGLVWVGVGLPVRLAREWSAVLFVCPASNRDAPDHVHAMTGTGLACDTGEAIVARLERAVVQGEPAW